MTIKTPIKLHAAGINIDLFVQPGTSQNKFAGLYADRLKLKVTAKAVDGAANEAVVKIIAKHFNVPKSAIEILSGTTSRKKTISIAGNAQLLQIEASKLLY